ERLRRRHERTFGPQRRDAAVVFVADPAFIGTFGGQVTWSTLLNVTARLYKGIGHFRIVIDRDVPRLPHVFFPNHMETLRDASLRMLEDLNPGALSIAEGIPGADGREWIWVYIGAAPADLPAGITVAGRGWLAFVNDESWKRLLADDNPIGAMVAA